MATDKEIIEMHNHGVDMSDLFGPHTISEGLDWMTDRLQFLLKVLKDIDPKGNRTKIEKARINKLCNELSFIKEIFTPKLKTYEILDLDIIFKYMPSQIEPGNLAYYNGLVSNKVLTNKFRGRVPIDQIKETNI